MKLVYDMLIVNKIEKKIMNREEHSRLALAVWDELLKEYGNDVIDVIETMGKGNSCISEFLPDLSTEYETNNFMYEYGNEIDKFIDTDLFNMIFGALTKRDIVHITFEDVISEILYPIVRNVLNNPPQVGNYYNN